MKHNDDKMSEVRLDGGRACSCASDAFNHDRQDVNDECQDDIDVKQVLEHDVSDVA